MRISDIKYLFPRIRFSTHTPKEIGYTEGYFMNKTFTKQNALEKSPIKDMVTSNPHAGCGSKMII